MDGYYGYKNQHIILSGPISIFLPFIFTDPDKDSIMLRASVQVVDLVSNSKNTSNFFQIREDTEFWLHFNDLKS